MKMIVIPRFYNYLLQVFLRQMLSSSSKSFLIKDILSKNHQSVSSDNKNEPENILLSKPIDLRYYFNNMNLLYPLILSSSALLLSKSIHDIESSPLNLLFEMNKQRFNQSNKSKYHL